VTVKTRASAARQETIEQVTEDEDLITTAINVGRLSAPILGFYIRFVSIFSSPGSALYKRCNILIL
jgi:hypothetical protein